MSAAQTNKATVDWLATMFGIGTRYFLRLEHDLAKHISIYAHKADAGL